MTVQPKQTANSFYVSNAQLGSSLRACAEAARGLGQDNRWRPNSSSETATVWRAAATDMRARTLTEADVQAITLIHSGLEHVVATAQSISGGRALLPHTLARTATEHLLRAQHLLDETASPEDRIQRRLNEWLYAIRESGYRRQGLLSSDVVAMAGLTPDDLGLSESDLLQQVHDRAEAVGEVITDRDPSNKKARVLRVEGTPGRLSTMRLAEIYTAGEAGGIPAFTMRGLSASVHGTEIGLLQSFSDGAPADPSLGGVIVPVPTQLDPPVLAFSLLGVLLSLVNATDSMRIRFAWPGHTKADRRYQREKDALLAFWSRALDAP